VQVQIQEVEQKVDVIRRKEDELESATGQMDSYAVLTRILTSFSAKRKGAAGRSQEPPLEEVKNLLTPLAHVPLKASRERGLIDSTPTPATPAHHHYPYDNPLL